MAISVVPFGRGFFAFYTALVKLSLLVYTANAGLVQRSVTVAAESLTAWLPFVTVFFKSTFWMILLLDMAGRCKASGA